MKRADKEDVKMNFVVIHRMVKRMRSYKIIASLLVVVLVCFSSPTFADEELSKELVAEYKPLLKTLLVDLESNPEDIGLKKEVGRLYFQIGNESKDRSSISKAIEIFQEILKRNPHDAEIKAYLGSAYTIKARDFPMKEILSFTPVGFVRLYYVKKGIKEMDKAMTLEPLNPFVRIVRGITCYNLPGIFGQIEKGVDDFSLLISWIENPSLNKNYHDVLIDQTFKAIVYYNAGEAYLKSGNLEKATHFFEMALSNAPQSPFGRAAERMLNKVKNKESKKEGVKS